MTVADHRRRKRTATPISEIPMSINASESVTTEVDFSAAKTPTKTPTIENNHRITRFPPHASRLGCRPASRFNDEISCKFRTVKDPLEYLRNRSTVPRRERQNCKGDTTIYVYDIQTRSVRDQTVRPGRDGGAGISVPLKDPPVIAGGSTVRMNLQISSLDTVIVHPDFLDRGTIPPRQIKISSGVAERI